MTDNSLSHKLTHPLITPDHLRRKALIYLRQSTPEQVRENTGSTELQRSQRDLARAYGWPDHLIEVIEEDLGKSGSSTAGRAGWQDMCQQIADKAVGIVLAINTSRLSRKLIDFETLRILASFHGVLFIMDGRVIDPKDANDAVLTQVTATIAQYENRKRAEIMSQSRMTRAQQGIVVSGLPIGWVKNPDGSYDYDVRVKETIEQVIETFWRVRTLRGTVLTLDNEGVKIPTRHGKQIVYNRPSLLNVNSILTNPAYTGTYTYGKTKCTPELGICANGESVRTRIPQHLWITIPNLFPPYLTPAAQAEIRSILKAHDFFKRDRAGRGSALCQGLLHCASCQTRFIVQYDGNGSHRYWCGWKTIKHAQKPCSSFDGKQLDKAIEREFLKVLRTPPLELLREALEESRRKEERRKEWIQAERERHKHESEKALERLDRNRREYPRVYAYAQQKLEEVLKAKDEFEVKIAAEQANEKPVPSAQEFEQLCAVANEVPNLWHHPLVTHQERKEILRCLIAKIVVTATKEKVEGLICWKSGHETGLRVWRQTGRHNLIQDLHAQGFTVPEIHALLARGQTSTGQIWKVHKLTLYHIHQRLGLKPNRVPVWYESLRQEAATLNEQGRSMKWIAAHFNSRGLKSLSGKPWTKKLIFSFLSKVSRKPYSLQKLHRNVIAEGRSRGLGYAEMAREFNERGIPRRDDRFWTAKAINERWYEVKNLGD